MQGSQPIEAECPRLTEIIWLVVIVAILTLWSVVMYRLGYRAGKADGRAESNAELYDDQRWDP